MTAYFQLGLSGICFCLQLLAVFCWAREARRSFELGSSLRLMLAFMDSKEFQPIAKEYAEHVLDTKRSLFKDFFRTPGAIIRERDEFLKQAFNRHHKGSEIIN